jgi:hypothetical protein
MKSDAAMKGRMPVIVLCEIKHASGRINSSPLQNETCEDDKFLPIAK